MAEHGTRGRYNKGCRCVRCREENRRAGAAMRERLAERGRVSPELIPHGRSAYINWGCRCTVCLEANVEYRRRLRRGDG
jgi:hypothetical protein